MTTKRIVLSFLVIAMVLLVACGKEAQPTVPPTQAPAAEPVAQAQAVPNAEDEQAVEKVVAETEPAIAAKTETATAEDFCKERVDGAKEDAAYAQERLDAEKKKLETLKTKNPDADELADQESDVKEWEDRLKEEQNTLALEEAKCSG